MAWLRFHPNFPIVYFNDPSHQRQPDASAINIWIEPVEETENSFMILLLNSDPIIAHKENWIAIRGKCSRPNFNTRLRLIAHEFDGIADQVLHHLNQTDLISADDGKIALNLHFHPASFQRATDQDR